MVTDVGSVLSVEDMLARSKAAAESKSSAAGGSKIQRMIAAMENGGQTDSVDLSPVAKLLKSTESSKPSSTPFTEQDWYINAKVAQLKGQIEMYSTLPGLDPSGAVMDSLTDEVNALVKGQREKLAKSQAEAAEKQAQLDKIEKEKADAPLSVAAMLARSKDRANGIEPPKEISKEVQALLDKLNKTPAAKPSAQSQTTTTNAQTDPIEQQKATLASLEALLPESKEKADDNVTSDTKSLLRALKSGSVINKTV